MLLVGFGVLVALLFGLGRALFACFRRAVAILSEIAGIVLAFACALLVLLTLIGAMVGVLPVLAFALIVMSCHVSLLSSLA